MNHKEMINIITQISKPGKKIFKLNRIFMLSILLIGLLFSSTNSIQASPQLLNGSTTISKINDRSLFSSTIAIGCSPGDLINAINDANTNPGPDVINLAENCTYQLTTFDNFNANYEYNGFPIITSDITINAHGANIVSLKDNMRAFEIATDGILSIDGLEIRDFTNDNEGGAILNHGALNISNSTFAINTAIKGGAIHNLGEATIFNSTFSYNRACCCLIKGADGGAIYNTGTLNIINATFADNSANREGDTFYNDGGRMVLKNSIITTDAFGANCSGDPLSDGGGNLRWPSDDESCVGTHDDPKLAPLSLNGGLTRTHALQPGSAAINAGLDSICAAEPLNNIAQNGVTRPYGPRCDIGAFELDYLVVSAITRAEPNPSNLDSVPFHVEFSKPVIGVDKSDFSLVTTGLSGASLTSIQGSSANYTVSVKTGANSGTIKLVLIDDDSIRDLEGDYLATEGVGNGDFSTGEIYIIDKINPTVVSINRVNSNPISKPSVDFTVKFSEPVIGVDLDDFNLAASDLINPAFMNLTGSGDTYIVTLDTGIGNGSLHLDLLDNDSITDAASNPLGGAGAGNGDFIIGQTYTILPNATFGDVPTNDWAYTWIERLYDADLTNGCYPDPLRYCPANNVTRAQMAKFILTAINGPQYDPIEANGIFVDVPYEEENLWYLDWVDELYRVGLTDGCSPTSLRYCPDASVSRAEMAKFILTAIEGKEYSPDPLQPGDDTGFEDVEPGYWAAPWITELNERGLTDGCQTNLYCPLAPVTRAQMAKFIMTAFNIP